MRCMIGNLNGFDIIISEYVPKVLKYPTGKKDGNKLGKRKCMMQINQLIYHTKIRKIFIHPQDFPHLEKILKK